MLEELLEDLNPSQREAVSAPIGPVLVLAGAGSGKTRVLTRRVAWLLAAGERPSSILAITFTNKAAGEMAERVRSLVGPNADGLWVSTFHAACARMLRLHPELGGLRSGWSIYDQDDARRLLERTIRRLDLDTKRFPPRAIAQQVSLAKARLVDPERFTDEAEGLYERQVAMVYRSYQAALAEANAADFDDLIGLVVEGLATRPELAEHWRRRFRHVLIDEYQDANPAQHAFVAELVGRSGSVFAVGDVDQSIYAFRGADPSGVLTFEERFDGAKVVTLEQNYRSTNAILGLANAVIAKNRRRYAKHLFSELGEGTPARRYQATDERDEARWVAATVREFLQRGGVDPSEIAVIFRTNAQSRPLEEAFSEAGIPFRVVGGVRFYERREVRDLLAYLRVLANPDDDVALARILNVPRRGIGRGTEEALQAAAALRGRSMLSLLRAEGVEVLGLTSRQERALRGFVELIDRLGALASLHRPSELIDAVVAETSYLEHLNEEDPITLEGRLENIAELRASAAEADDLESFLERAALVSAVDEVMGASGVTLLTAHAAKGLEFDVVVVVGLEEGVFPHVRAIVDAEAVEEERRLFYVAMTRARTTLVLTSARRRASWGEPLYNPPSRFLDELPADLVATTAAPVAVGTACAESIQRASAVVEARAARSEWVVGDRVFHARYGEGTIRRVVPRGVDDELVIAFHGAGERRFFASMVKLRRA
ncbi:UvrD/REP helicase [Acidimicrobium ferrooxidans DSM 10331]|uniref:ATP-dependent DNA helicase UvrD1 n=1 Tax=Acidimicrobium ferrooxidans (strain DSM 10331 / JCM 15462 / NBRC 103882 / ICP) TaxID=525909 RepID=C7M335_ACIFD|nr:UvrD-helicase domain-containing protein [Acidimicrobium ferrooxidans]ACU53429.1 UvrD/REP helicase [Acidimicrobium ferrooxidans DSM 10331]